MNVASHLVFLPSLSKCSRWFHISRFSDIFLPSMPSSFKLSVYLHFRLCLGVPDGFIIPGFLIYFPHLCLGLPDGLLSLDFPNETLYAYRISVRQLIKVRSKAATFSAAPSWRSGVTFPSDCLQTTRHHRQTVTSSSVHLLMTFFSRPIIIFPFCYLLLSPMLVQRQFPVIVFGSLIPRLLALLSMPS